MNRLFRLCAMFCLVGILAAAQTATVTRNVNLRSTASTDKNPITTLTPGTELQLLEPNATTGYFHVKISAGSEGWVWSRNVLVKTEAGTASGIADHVGPARLYPVAAETPGLADTLVADDLTKKYTEHCPKGKAACTYSQAHRNVASAVHAHVYVEYNVPQSKRNGHDGEVDHFHPLCAGGSNDIKNLWYQPAVNDWKGKDFGFHAKDRLETFVCAQIKAGTMTPKDAYERITTDWVKFYLDEGLDDEN